MRIAIQGERGSFHEVAVRQYFSGNEIELVPCTTFDSTINSVKRGGADIAVIAIENARSGSILYNYSLIRESGLKVQGEHNLRIKQNLMAIPGQTIDLIREVWSHPVAISQCMNFLNQHPGLSLIESADTAASARRIREGNVKGVAAIGADLAASIYELDILANSIETYKKNYTRFLVLGTDGKKTERANKASVCFSLGHAPGSLATLLVILAEMNVNLSKIQSVPKINSEWEYLFYLDLEFEESLQLNELIKVLENNSKNLEILGIYMKGNELYENQSC